MTSLLDPASRELTAFRAAEKKYKARFPPPDLSDLLDLALLDVTRFVEIQQTGWKGSADAVQVKAISLKGDEERVRKAYTITGMPGLVILPFFVSTHTQRDLIKWSLRDHARHPNETNLDTHYLLPPRQLISNTPASPSNFALLKSTSRPQPVPSAHAQPLSTAQLLPRLRWANIGWFYHWGAKQYDFAREVQPVGEPFRSICWRDVFGHLDAESLDGWGDGGPDWQTWEEMYARRGIVNFYQTKDTLMGHVDRSEICATSPLPRQRRRFLIGGLTRDVAPIPILLRSGDVIVMSGPACRRAYHGVPRILEGTLPEHLGESVKAHDGAWAPYAQYMRTARINVNVRQVFPKGFNPGPIHP
ncbi:hypothetical protein BGW80DRAFT_1288883 [Lactifluus volemus]|nr:hypothetical protein BGW80DRAFT_1288883 [Lactifluus volemus]